MTAQKARITQLSVSVPKAIGAKFDALGLEFKRAAAAAIASAHASGKATQQALQVATADKAANDYEKRKNKAAGDAAVLAAEDAQAAIAKTLEENLAMIPAVRDGFVAAAKKSVGEMEARINAELVKVDTASTESKKSLEAGMSGLEGAFVTECDTMVSNAKGQIAVEAEALIAELDAGVKAYQQTIETSLEATQAQLTESAAWADKQFAGLSERFAEWTQLVDSADRATLKTFQSDLASAQAQTQAQFSDHVLIIAASLVRETNNGIDMVRERGGNATSTLTQVGARLAGGIPQLTDGLATAATTIAAKATQPLDTILAETGPSSAAIEADLAALEKAPETVGGLTQQRAQEFGGAVTQIATTLLDTETAGAIATAQGKVIKKPGRWTWARVLTAIVSVVASAFTIAGLVAWGLPAAATILLAGTAFTAIGQVKQTIQAIMAGEKLTWASRGKEAVLSFATGILASMGGLMMAAVPLRGVLSIIDLSPVFVALKGFFSWAAESLVGKIAVRSVLGMLPRKIDELIQWLGSKGPVKKKKDPMMLAAEDEVEQTSLEARISRSVAADNTAAIKGGKMLPGSGTVATIGHVIKGTIGG